MAQVPTRTTFFIASAFSSPIATTVVTNATNAVVTAAAHGYANGDFVEITSGWGRLNGRVFRISGVATNTFTLDGADTSSTTFYPTGNGLGTVRKINTFTQIIQQFNPQTQGGEPRQVNYRYTDSDVDYQINDGFTAVSYSLELDADSNSTAGYTALRTLTESQAPTCFRMVLPAGGQVLVPCTVALNEAIRLQEGQVNRVAVTFAGINRPTRY